MGCGCKERKEKVKTVVNKVYSESAKRLQDVMKKIYGEKK